MKTKMSEIKKLGAMDLEKFVAEKREALRLFRFGISGSKTKNVKEGAKIRKEIARALTEVSLRRAEARSK